MAARRGLCVLAALSLAACAGTPPPACSPVASTAPVEAGTKQDRRAGDSVTVVAHGWHTDLALPTASLRGPMTVFRRIFPGATVLVVGFGKRTFMMAPVRGLGDLLIGPFPGTGTLLVAGLTAPVDRAYSDGTMAVLPMTPAQATRLSDFLWHSFALSHGMPRKIGNGFFPGSVFYAAESGYSGFYTCNSWSDDALHAAGLAASPVGVVFAAQVMRRAAAKAGGECAIAGNA